MAHEFSRLLIVTIFINKLQQFIVFKKLSIIIIDDKFLKINQFKIRR